MVTQPDRMIRGYGLRFSEKPGLPNGRQLRRAFVTSLTRVRARRISDVGSFHPLALRNDLRWRDGLPLGALVVDHVSSDSRLLKHGQVFQ
jgi:hypothetical protein